MTCTTNADRFVYVANGDSNNISAYAINAASGALANASSSNVSVYAIDASSGTLTADSGSPFAAGSLPYAVAVGHWRDRKGTSEPLQVALGRGVLYTLTG